MITVALILLSILIIVMILVGISGYRYFKHANGYDEGFSEGYDYGFMKGFQLATKEMED
jgi:hypothetical protein